MRIKRALNAKKKRKTLLRATKGYLNTRKSCYRKAKEAFYRAGRNAYRDRKLKKRAFRALWQIKLNAAVRLEGLIYSKFVYALKEKKIELNRKVLSQVAEFHPLAFKRIVEIVKK